MIEAEARKHGYEVVRGSYVDTPDDRLDGWYVQRLDATVVSRLGPGYPTKRAALDAVAEWLSRADDDEWLCRSMERDQGVA